MHCPNLKYSRAIPNTGIFSVLTFAENAENTQNLHELCVLSHKEFLCYVQNVHTSTEVDGFSIFGHDSTKIDIPTSQYSQ